MAELDLLEPDRLVELLLGGELLLAHQPASDDAGVGGGLRLLLLELLLQLEGLPLRFALRLLLGLALSLRLPRLLHLAAFLGVLDAALAVGHRAGARRRRQRLRKGSLRVAGLIVRCEQKDQGHQHRHQAHADLGDEVLSERSLRARRPGC